MKYMLAIMLCVFAGSVSASEQHCLALNIYHEARGESEEAQMAVAHVTLNRVVSSRFPDSICGVVKQAKRDSAGKIIRHRCQFSWFCDGQSDKISNNVIEQRAWKRAKQIAKTATQWHEAGEDFSRGALFYHAEYVRPYWATHFVPTAKIDRHIFYR